MKRARKSSNRVSWAPPRNLCQVKLFISEDCPSKVGQKSQHHLQAKMSSMLRSTSSTIEFNDLPPGFDCHLLPNQSKHELYFIPQINWRCPSRFVFSYKWHVVAGEESKEKEDQKLRELGVLEAVYPRLSAIPPCPSVALGIEEGYDDNVTPVVPVIPIEEEESMDDKPELAAAREAPATVQSQSLHQYMSVISAPIQNAASSPALTVSGNPLPGLEEDLGAASAVVSAIMKNSEQGSLIDMNLLVKIFNDPLMIEKLVNDHRTAAGLKLVPPSMPGKLAIPFVSKSCMSNGAVPTLDAQPPQQDAFMATGSLASIPTISSSGGLQHSMTTQARSTASAMPHHESFAAKEAHSVKDANYLKSLIRQHGSDRQDTQDSQPGIRHSNFQNLKLVHNNKPGEVKNKIQKKTCMYFNSPRGCRNGSSCPYQHDMSLQWEAGNALGGQNRKRSKLEPEIKGRI